jgi:TRAP-type mannitol/chloroaromatic compound transport system permease large subunit
LVEDVVIPTLLLVALVLGTLIHDRASLRRSVAVGAAISVLWGGVVGAGDASATTAAGGTALGRRTFSWARQSVRP